MGWVVNAPAELLPEKTLYPLNRRLGGPQGRSERVWKFSPSLGFDLRNVQPVTSFYTGSIKGAVWNSKYCETLSFESWKFPNQWESGFWRLWIYILIYCTTLSDGTAVGVGQRLPLFFFEIISFPETHKIHSERATGVFLRTIGFFVQGELEGTWEKQSW